MWLWFKEKYICDVDETPDVNGMIFFFGSLTIFLIIGVFIGIGLFQQWIN